MKARRIMIIGATKAGKSAINNQLTGLPPARTAEDELNPRFGVRVGATNSSTSDRVVHKGPVDMHSASGTYQLVVSDSPGVPDTDGRGIDFLDDLVWDLKTNPPHGIVYVVNGSEGWPAGLACSLAALRECFQNVMDESRLIILVNKLPTDFAYEQGGAGVDEITRLRSRSAQQLAQRVAKCLLPGSHGAHRRYIANVSMTFDGVAALKEEIAVLPSTVMSVSRFLTWSEADVRVEKSLSMAMMPQQQVKGLQNKFTELQDCMQHVRSLMSRSVHVDAVRDCEAILNSLMPEMARIRGNLDAAQRGIDEVRRECQEDRRRFAQLEADLDREVGTAREARVKLNISKCNLMNVNSFKVLNVPGGNMRNGVHIQQWDNPDSVDSQWKIEHVGNGEHVLTSLRSGKVLNVHGGAQEAGRHIIQWDNPGDRNSRWLIERTSGARYIITAVHSNKVLNVFGGQKDNGARVIQWNRNDDLNSRWWLLRVA